MKTKCLMCESKNIEMLSATEAKCNGCNCNFYIPEKENNIESKGGKK